MSEALFRSLGQDAKRRIADRLRRGQGFEGRLEPKEESGGGRLGGRLPAAISAGRVRARPESFEISFGSNSLEKFHNGDPGPPRPIIGLTAEDRSVFRARAVRDLIADGKRLGIVKRGR